MRVWCRVKVKQGEGAIEPTDLAQFFPRNPTKNFHRVELPTHFDRRAKLLIDVPLVIKLHLVP